jgi:hypothetical protein
MVTSIMTTNARYARSILVALGMTLAASLAAGQTSTAPTAGAVGPTAESFDQLKQLLKERYDGKAVVVQVPGLYAGEQKKLLFGPGDNGIYWAHFAEGAQIPTKRASNLNQLDDSTFGMLNAGLNVSPIGKGERLKVYKFYVTPDFVQLVLTTTSLEHMRDLDMSKASREVTTTVGRNQVNQTVAVNGFGLVFSFHFKKGTIKEDHDYAAVVREINKYLLPESEAQQTVKTQQNVDIEPGMTEDQVIQKLGQPLQAIRFGDQKSLKYNGMTVVLKDGKVIDLKVE